MRPKMTTLASLALACVLVAACGSETSGNGTSAPSSNAPTASSYAETCTARANRCGDAGSSRPDDCTADFKCYTQALVESYATEVLNCLSSRTCEKPAVSTCLAPVADRVGDRAFSKKCDDRLGECKLSDDYCQDASALFKPEVRAAFEACLQKDCSAIQACLDAALPACRF